MTIIGLAPSVELAIVGIGFVGLAGGAFLAVDWALMTDIIPKASAGRYMGLSNVVEATNGADRHDGRRGAHVPRRPGPRRGGRGARGHAGRRWSCSRSGPSC